MDVQGTMERFKALSAAERDALLARLLEQRAQETDRRLADVQEMLRARVEELGGDRAVRLLDLYDVLWFHRGWLANRQFGRQGKELLDVIHEANEMADVAVGLLAA